MGFFAIGTSICIALAGLISAEVLKAVGGPISLSRWRMIVGFVMLSLVATATGGWSTLRTGHLPFIILSSLAGIAIADPALNGGIARIGARRAALIFSLSAPFAAILGFLVLGETIGFAQVMGCALVACGIAVAVGFGKTLTVAPAADPELVRNESVHAEDKASLTGLLLVVIAALGQAVGILAMRPVMLDHVDPFGVMAVRVLAAGIVMWTLYLASPRTLKHGVGIPDRRSLALLSLGMFVGYVVGMSMLMIALSATSVAITSTLASMAPVAILPMLWFRTGTRPAWQAWCGAFVAVTGTAIIFWR
ncbi:DMT family transporter [Microvirga sp. 2TAF3]|uniref:DMT family transporter n=1 Tax=Microvirga sp. 2TAF3 TaxID=3233014 RepID=UPI003F95FB29